MDIGKVIVAFLLCLALGGAVLFCFNHEGELEKEAAVLEACLQQNTERQYADCPDRPISQTEIDDLRKSAETYNTLAWVAGLILFFGAGGLLFAAIRGEDDDGFWL